MAVARELSLLSPAAFFTQTKRQPIRQPVTERLQAGGAAYRQGGRPEIWHRAGHTHVSSATMLRERWKKSSADHFAFEALLEVGDDVVLVFDPD